jgi:histidine triad (HIT) family protein
VATERRHAVAKKTGKGDPVLDALRKASKGLLFTRETDAPLEPFVWVGGPDKLSDKDVVKFAGEDYSAAVEEQSLDDFFRAVPPEDKAKFDELAKVLKEQLSGIRVYKVGDEAEKTAYIVGRTKDNRWAGLKTTVVET